MKRAGILIFSLVTLLIACSGNNIYVDKAKKAIISRNGKPLQKVVVDGGGTEVTFFVYDKTKDNSAIYFNRHNPNFMASEGFGLNKDYVLKLKPSAKYTVTADAGNGQSQIIFRTDFNGDIKEPEGD